MALSNQDGHLVLATGNKSELAVGYSTLYGDAVGGFAPLKDVSKTLVWRLARWRNKSAEERAEIPPIPESCINKPPSASFAQASWTPIRCRRTSCSTTCSTTTSSRIAALVTSSHQDSTRTWSSACSAWSTRRSTSGVSTPGTEDLAARVRTRSAAADHQPVARASAATHGRGAAERLSVAASSAGRPERCRRCAHIADDWMPVWCRPSRPCCAGGARGRRA